MRVTFFSRSLLVGFVGIAGLVAAPACGGQKPAVDAAMAPEVAQVDAAPAAPPSRLEEAKAIFAKPLDVAGIEGALALADALAAESSPGAKIAAARIRVMAVARDVVQVADGGESKIASGAATQLQIALKAAKELGGDEGARVHNIANGLAFMVGAERPAAGGLLALVADASPEAAAYRQALVARYAQAREQGDARGFDAFAAMFGPLVCEGCDKALGPDADVGPQVTPGLKAAQAADPIAAVGANALAVAALELDAAVGGGPEPVVLPVPVVLSGEATLGPTGPEVGLGEVMPALIVASLGPTDVKIGARAIVAKGGVLPKLAAGVGLRDAVGVTYEVLQGVEPDKATGAIAGITDTLATVRAATAEVPEGWSGPLPGDKGAVLLAVAPEVAVEVVSKVADGIIAGGSAAVRVLRPGTNGEVLPLHVRGLPVELEAALVPDWEKSMIVVVGKAAIDVWGPEGAKDGAAPIGADAVATLPTTSQQGWRKDKLARLQVPLNVEVAGPIAAAELAALVEAVKVFADKAKAGRVIHVVAGEGATVAAVLEVSRHLQEVGLEAAPELARVAEIWPGARCRGPSGCAGAVAVAFSKREVPSSRGLSDKPSDKKDEPKEPREAKPEVGPAPSAEFCNQADIKSNMAKKAGGFRFCYERELQLEKDLAGRVVMNFVIGMTGNVKSVRVASSELASAKVGECIKKEISKITFKAPDGGECVVQWPFKFTAN